MSLTTSSPTYRDAFRQSRESILSFAEALEGNRDRRLEPLSASTSRELSSVYDDRTDLAASALPEEDIFSRIAGLLGEDMLSVAAPRPQTNVIVTGRWEGAVTNVGQETFDGQFVPVDRREPRLEATFLISEVDEDDLELIRPGALFYIVASEVRVSARRWQPSSVVQFRRIPRVTENDIADASAQAAKLRQKLGLEE